MGKKRWFVLIDRYGLIFGPARLVRMRLEVAGYVRLMVMDAFRNQLAGIDVPSLEVYASWDAFNGGSAPLESADSISALGATGVATLVVMSPRDKFAAISPSTSALPAATQDVHWFGLCGTQTTGEFYKREGVDLKNTKTLHRRALVDDIVTRLDMLRVFEINTAPMTGKTALAALICRDIHNRSATNQQRVAIACHSMIYGHCNGVSFEAGFYSVCGIQWADFLGMRERGYTLYLVIDDAQLLYQSQEDPSSIQKSQELWQLVENVLVDASLPVRVLLLCGISHPDFSPPVQLPADQVFGSERLRFSEDEVQEYVRQWFLGVSSLDEEALLLFLRLLVALTGCHVGLTVLTIDLMNRVYQVHERERLPSPTPEEWIDMLHLGSLDGFQLEEYLGPSNAVRRFHLLGYGAEERLERLLYDMNANDDHETEGSLHDYVRAGILLDNRHGQYAFTSPMMWRQFVKDCLDRVPRATTAPATLDQLMARCQHAIDYSGVLKTLRREPYNANAIEQAWQLAFYKAVYRSTPYSITTSVDVGALFGAPAFLELIVRHGDAVWGIALLRDEREWHEQVGRFKPGGQYAHLGLTGGCVVTSYASLAVDVATRGVASCELSAEALSLRWVMLNADEFSLASLALND